MAVLLFLAPLASPSPDGLERVAEDAGFSERAFNVIEGIMPDYGVPGMTNPAGSTVVSGLFGTVVAFGVLIILGKVLARGQRKRPS